MSKLTCENVEKIFRDCLFNEGEDTSKAVMVNGIVHEFGFHPERLAGHRTEIGELLTELPDEFHISRGGGWTFLNACMDREGNQWGEHMNMEQLLVLGIATKQARFLMDDRKLWKALPGGMPYFSIGTLPETKPAEAQTPA